jgi:hypothetical protein
VTTLSSFTSRFSANWRQTTWTFHLGDEPPIEITTETRFDATPADDEAFARELAARIGWAQPPSHPS